MSRLTRRSFTQWSLSTLAASSIVSKVAGADEASKESADSVSEVYDFARPALGRVQPVPADNIKASPLSVGFETLDREHFDPKKTYPHLAKLGVKWARCQTGWCRCETTPGQYTFAWLDEVVDSLLAIGVQPWFNLGYGNQLYAPKADKHAVGWAPVFDEQYKKAWLNFTRAIAEHFADRVKCWEIWNEPNISGFWKPEKPNATDYVDLVKITAPEIRKRVSDAVIIGGAYAGMPTKYFEQCMAEGMGDYVDRVSYHPYRPVPESGYASTLAEWRKTLAKHNDKLRFWQGENGCPSKGGKGSAGALSKLNWNETRQAKWLTRRILTDLRLEVELTSYFHLVDLVGYRGITNFKGLLRGTDYSPKPSFFAYQCLAALFDSQPQHKSAMAPKLSGELPKSIETAGFVRNGHGICAYWVPANLQKRWTPTKVNVSLPATAGIKQPVMVDPLSSRVYSLTTEKGTDGQLALADLPLLDYPLLITDQAVALGS